MVSDIGRVRRAALALTCGGALAVTGCAATDTSESGPPSPTASPTAPVPAEAPTPSTTPSTPAASATVDPTGAGSAALALAGLPVKGRAPMTGYDRAEFGPAWLDADRNGCDTRNDALRDHLTRLVIDPRTHGCRVLSGVLADPYTGRSIDFVVGDGTLVDVDHVVALGDAWATGAAAWPIRRRAAFANDPLNLLPVDASANRQKGDGDAATWLPAVRGYRCAYVGRQVAVKAKYGLWVKPAERAAIARLLAACPGQPLPDDVTHAPLEVTFDVPEPSTPPEPVDGAFASCDAARAAGAAPVRRGDPGYGPHLDGDGDGVACE